jgi:hypothetical protein
MLLHVVSGLLGLWLVVGGWRVEGGGEGSAEFPFKR